MIKNKMAPLFWGLAIGIALASMFQSILFFLCLIGAIFAAYFFKKRFFAVVLVCCLVGSFALLFHQPKHITLSGDGAIVTGYIADEVSPGRGQRKGVYNIRNAVVTIDGQDYPLNKMVRAFTDDDFTPGDQVQFTGALSPYQVQRNPNGEDWQKIMLAKGVSHYVYTTREQVTGRVSNPFTFFGGLKQQITGSIDEVLGENNSAMVKAILLGEKSDIEQEITRDYRIAGISHILAISGLHIGILVGAICWVLRKSHTKIKLFYVSVFLLCFLFLTCFNPSVYRAGLMAMFWLYASAKGYRYHILTSLFASGIIILIANPYHLFSAGFLLSFTCVLGIGLFYRWFYQRLSIFYAPIRASIAIYLACQVAMLPVSIWFFNSLPLYSALANIFAVPLVSFALIAALIGVILLPFGLGYVPLVFSYSIMKIINYIARVVADMPYSSVPIPTPPMWLLLSFYGLLLFATIYYLHKKQAAALLGTCMMGTMLLVNFHSFGNTPQVTMLDVGDGLAIHIKTEHNKHIIIDGSRELRDENVLVKYLRSIGANDLILVNTHDDLDHYGGFVSMVSQFRIKAYLSPTLEGDDIYNDFIQSLKDNEVDTIQFLAGSNLEFDGIELSAIAPSYLSKNSNENSLNAYIRIHGKTMLITGDTPVEQEVPYQKVDILQVAHHGSKTSTSDTMLEQTKPEIALVSGDRYIDQSVISRLGRYYDTKESGAVRLWIENNIKVKTMRGQK